jgi:hypothetical protein
MQPRHEADLTVLLPVREPAPWLDDCLGSLASQSLHDFQVLLLVHGEGQDTVEARVPPSLHGRYRTHACPSQWPFSRVLNFGLLMCATPLIARMDSDDLALPDRLAAERGILLTSPEAVLAASQAVRIDCSGSELGLAHRWMPEGLGGRLLWKNILVHSAVTFRREAALAAGGYREAATGCEDYDLWLRMGAVGEICLLDEVLVAYRVHPRQISASPSIDTAAIRAVTSARRQYADSRGIRRISFLASSVVWGAVQLSRLLAFRVKVTMKNALRHKPSSGGVNGFAP